MEHAHPSLRKELLKTVNIQIKTNVPPETKQTFQRLVSEGISEKEARRLIALALAMEMADVMESMKPFDPKRYAARLARLPGSPWDDEGTDDTP